MKIKHSRSHIILYIVGGIGGLAVIGGLAYYLTPGAAQQNYVATPVSRMDLTQTVTATGVVAADQQSVLAFDGNGGTIASVTVAVGDHVVKGEVLATLESDILQSSLEGAQADVAAAQANLGTAQLGTRPEELAVYEQKYNDASAALVAQMKASYLAAEDAVINKADQLFLNGDTVNPVINVRTQSQTEQYNIEQERLALKYTLSSLKDALSTLNPPASGLVATSSFESARVATNAALTATKTYLDDLGNIAANLSTGNTGQSQDIIDSDRTIVNAASQEVAGAISAEQGADSAWSDAQDALVLQQSGSTSQDIEAAEASLAKAQSEADADQNLINHSKLVAPFDGVVTDVEPKIGEVFSAGTPAITVISGGAFKVDVQVSETDVAKLAVGDAANVTLSAYGSGTSFPATVTTIDPGETVVNGVNSYQVTLHFTTIDPRILSGMTANISVVTATSTNTLAIPQGDIITKGTNTFVLIKNTSGNGYSEAPVTTGITGSNGYVQITSGLSDGETIASF